MTACGCGSRTPTFGISLHSENGARVTDLFFDEQHTVKHIQIVNSIDDRAELELLVRWQSGWWEPPAATSKHIDLEVSQRWVVRRRSTDKNAFGLEIVECAVSEDFRYAPGSDILAPTPSVDPNDLVALNATIGDTEQAGDVKALAFCQTHLSDQLIFRRANGKVVGKSEPGGFLLSIKKNPFSFRQSKDISITQLGDRALVTLIVVSTRADDGSIHHYRNVRLFTTLCHQLDAGALVHTDHETSLGRPIRGLGRPIVEREL